MKKKLVVAVLAVAMMTNVLTGCGLSKSTEASRPNAVDTSAETFDEEFVSESLVGMYEETATYDYEANASENANTYNSDSVMAEYSKAATDEWYDYDENDCTSLDYFNPTSGEKYTEISENEYTEVSINPLSTFAADVDTASYANLRRMINDGMSLYSINPDAVRTEEIVNYFKYNYKEPMKGEVFGVDAQISTCPWNKSSYLMTLGINTATMDSEDIPDCNVVFLIDVSGSMASAKKIPLIQKTMALLVDSFDKNDRISIVTYANGVETVLDGCKGNDSRKIIKAFESLSAGGSTNGGDGIKTAYRIAERNYIKGGVNRVVVCSDGDFNVGLTSKSELEDLISEKKDTGIFLSTLGFGMGNYSDTTMETLADKGNGNYAYIDNLTEAKKVLIDEMTSTFVTIAKDVKLQVEFNPALVSKYRLVGYENRALNAEDFKDDTKDGGEMGAGHQVTAIYEICLAEDIAENSLRYQDTKLSKKGAKGDEYCTLSIAYKEPSKDKSNYLEFPIGTSNMTSTPSENYRLAVALAQASLALKNSEYLVDMDRMDALESSIKIVKNLNNRYENEYIAEFAELMETLIDNDSYYEWYE